MYVCMYISLLFSVYILWHLFCAAEMIRCSVFYNLNFFSFVQFVCVVHSFLVFSLSNKFLLKNYYNLYTSLFVCFVVYFKRCVTLARATAKACNAENGYWKSNVYALPSMRPNCITYWWKSGWRGMNNINTFLNSVWTYLFSSKFYLEIFSRFLCYPPTEIQLVNLTHFIPHWRLVMHDKFSTYWGWLIAGRWSIRLDSSTF